jgi:hypothetical protein
MSIIAKKIAIVEWIDPQIITDAPMRGWLSRSEFEKWCEEGLIVCQSIGWLTYEDDAFIVISQTKFDDDLAESIKIPRSSIKELIIKDTHTL